MILPTAVQATMKYMATQVMTPSTAVAALLLSILAPLKSPVIMRAVLPFYLRALATKIHWAVTKYRLKD